MNKKEVLEIKKQFTPGNCSITRICSCYVDGEKNIKAETRESFLSLQEEDAFKYFEILRKGLSGKLGRTLINLEFPNKAEESGGAQEFLLRLRNSRLKDNDLLEEFYDRIIENYDYAGNYLILVIHDAYDIPGKASDGCRMVDASDEVYEYIQCCICPVELSKPGLGYSEPDNAFKNRIRDRVAGMPDTAFLFPAFNDRSADIHGTLLYAKKDLKPLFIEEVLGCGIPLESEYQRQVFEELVENVLGNNCTCEAVKVIYQNLFERIEESKDMPEPLSLGKQEIRNLFEASGVEDDALIGLNALYDDLIGTNELLAYNLMNDGEFIVQLPEAVVKIDTYNTGDVAVRIIDGRKCLVIGVSGEFKVNGVTCKR